MSTFEFTFADGHTSLASGRTRSKARYNKFLDFDDCFETFGDFLKFVVSVRKVSAPVDSYNYISRAYGKSFHVGQRVHMAELGQSKEENGEVVYPNGNTHYVHILIDGSDNVGLFHPGSVEPVDI